MTEEESRHRVTTLHAPLDQPSGWLVSLGLAFEVVQFLLKAGDGSGYGGLVGRLTVSDFAQGFDVLFDIHDAGAVVLVRFQDDLGGFGVVRQFVGADEQPDLDGVADQGQDEGKGENGGRVHRSVHDDEKEKGEEDGAGHAADGAQFHEFADCFATQSDLNFQLPC